MCNGMVMNSCCCGSVQESGVKATAIYSVILSLFYTGLKVFYTYIYVLYSRCANYHCSDSIYAMSPIFMPLSDINAELWLLFSIGLFFGIKKDKSIFLLGWLVYILIITIRLLVKDIILIASRDIYVFKYTLSGAIYVINVLAVFSNAYCWLVVYTYYRRLGSHTDQGIPELTSHPGSIAIGHGTGYNQFQNMHDASLGNTTEGYTPAVAYPNTAMQPQAGYTETPPDYKQIQQV